MDMMFRGWLGLLALFVAVAVARTSERATIGGFLGKWDKISVTFTQLEKNKIQSKPPRILFQIFSNEIFIFFKLVIFPGWFYV